MKKGRIEKALKPSQRKSVTEFSTSFGTGASYEDKVRRRKITNAVFVAIGVVALIIIGFFVTDTLICVTELEPTTAVSTTAQTI